MSIRRLTPADAPDYRALRLRALWEHPQAFTSSYEDDSQEPLQIAEARLAQQHSAFWGAFEDGLLCGMVGLERERRAKNCHKAAVVGLYVAAEYIGRGLGGALMRALIEHARSLGLELLVLTVTQGDSAALRLYESVGFCSFGVEPHAVKVDGRAFAKNHMFLTLNASS